MNRVQNIEVELEKDPSSEGKERLQHAYDRIIEMALTNLSTQHVDKSPSTESYIEYN